MPHNPSRSGRVAVKIGVHVLALVALAACTVMMVSEAPYILEEETNANAPLSPDTMQAALGMGAKRGADKPEMNDDLFDLLTSPETTESVVQEPAAWHPAERAAEPPTTMLTIENPLADVDESDKICAERGPPLCRNVSATCVKHGPSCKYEKMCVAKDDTCIPDGICMQPQQKCHPVFPKACVECAKTNPACQHAHTVATECVSQCEETCIKDALCEQKCAAGCLQKYEGFMGSCKRDCKPCQAGGTKQVCHDDCNNWKQCGESINRCVMENECKQKGIKCSFTNECLEHKQQCGPVQKCTLEGKECKQTKHCLVRDTKCSHEPTAECAACRTNTMACKGEDKVKQACYGDCQLQCDKSKPGLKQGCLNECLKGCHSSEEALGGLCNHHCPACKTPNPACHFKCLKEESKLECKAVCKKQETVQECKSTCSKHKQVKTCVDVCSVWKQKKKCKQHCQQWKFSQTRPCRYHCKEHGFERVCHQDKTTCVAWSGGKVCDKLGPCLSWKGAGSTTSSMAENATNATEQTDVPHTPHTDEVDSVPGKDAINNDTDIAGTIVMPNGATVTPGQQPAPLPMSPGPVIVGDSENSSAIQTGEQVIPAGWVQPVSNDSKIGKVMAEATDDVERLLGGQPIAKKPSGKKAVPSGLQETSSEGVHVKARKVNKSQQQRIVAAAKDARESLLAAQEELSTAEKEQVLVYRQPHSGAKQQLPAQQQQAATAMSESDTMASRGWQEVSGEEPVMSAAPMTYTNKVQYEAAQEFAEAQRQEQVYIASVNAAQMALPPSLRAP